ncbi:hypothetical protein LEP1GSC187_0510 [Leptospira santarosai str. ZUN179]|uniref:Uncharacterized protein n=1 Tax=Leptospira santarosai str. ZUN179 TaxID=1049985 RepID=M6URV8_9LEPT|nr:hypothetical protein LEP1GSC187_0510 [Leptospira santarosai str. ZUN179]
MPKRKSEHTKNNRPNPLLAKELSNVSEKRMLRFLLAECFRRLREARRLERDRKIVYPETTSIVRDCERLIQRLRQEAKKGKADPSVTEKTQSQTLPQRKKTGMLG